MTETGGIQPAISINTKRFDKLEKGLIAFFYLLLIFILFIIVTSISLVFLAMVSIICTLTFYLYLGLFPENLKFFEDHVVLPKIRIFPDRFEATYQVFYDDIAHIYPINYFSTERSHSIEIGIILRDHTLRKLSLRQSPSPTRENEKYDITEKILSPFRKYIGSDWDGIWSPVSPFSNFTLTSEEDEEDNEQMGTPQAGFDDLPDEALLEFKSRAKLYQGIYRSGDDSILLLLVLALNKICMGTTIYFILTEYTPGNPIVEKLIFGIVIILFSLLTYSFWTHSLGIDLFPYKKRHDISDEFRGKFEPVLQAEIDDGVQYFPSEVTFTNLYQDMKRDLLDE